MCPDHKPVHYYTGRLRSGCSYRCRRATCREPRSLNWSHMGQVVWKPEVHKCPVCGDPGVPEITAFGAHISICPGLLARKYEDFLSFWLDVKCRLHSAHPVLLHLLFKSLCVHRLRVFITRILPGWGTLLGSPSWKSTSNPSLCLGLPISICGSKVRTGVEARSKTGSP